MSSSTIEEDASLAYGFAEMKLWRPEAPLAPARSGNAALQDRVFDLKAP